MQIDTACKRPLQDLVKERAFPLWEESTNKTKGGVV